MAHALPFLFACEPHKEEVHVPSPLFNFLFLAALIVPMAMYIAGVVILMASLVVKHNRGKYARAHSIEALVH